MRSLKSAPLGLLLLTLLTLSSQTTTAQTCTTSSADGSQVVETMRQFYAAAAADDLQKFHTVVTPTFYAYDGGVRYGALRDSRAAVEQARQTLIATRLAAVVAAAQAERAVSVVTASRDVAKLQRDLADRIDQRTRQGYAQGAGTSLDLVVSAQSLRQADINLVLLDVQVGEARANAVLANAKCIY